MSTTLATLEQRLCEYLHDWISVALTTNLAANTYVISTNLKSYDGSADNYFYNWWIYITTLLNAGVERQISAYTSSTGTNTIRGANFSADSSAATVRFSRYPESQQLIALNKAIRQIYSNLHRKVDNRTLIVGNALPNSHFEDWTVSTYPDKYTLSSVTAAAETGVANKRGGSKSAKVTASAGNGYLYISSNDYPRLLDLQGQMVDFKCWVKPEVANDAILVIYTIKPDGTAQTLSSTTTCPAGYWTQLLLTDQTLNSGLSEIQFRFKITTNAKYVYFDDARVIGNRVSEYLLPTTLLNGDVDQVFTQIGGTGVNTDACDDLFSDKWDKSFYWDIKEDGTDRFLYLDDSSILKRIRLVGRAPLETLSAQTDTLSLNEGTGTEALIALAAHLLLSAHARPMGSDDVSRTKLEDSYAYQDYQRLIRKNRMWGSSGTLKGL